MATNKNITLKDIAKHFGVSVSTVSKAINDSHEISGELKGNIRSYAQNMRYRPNQMALNLRRSRTRTIGVVVPNILNHFFAQVLYGIQKVAAERDYHVISCISDESYEKESKTLQLLDAGTVDGILMSLSEQTQRRNDLSEIQKLQEQGLPLVLFDRVSDRIACDKVIVDDFEAGHKATTFLLQRGCTSIVWVTPIGESSVGRLRLRGHQRALEEAGISFDATLVVDLHDPNDLEAIIHWLLAHKQVNAMVGLDELTAVRLLHLVRAKGLQVPQDMAIIGFTNGPLSQYVTPSLTTISQHGKHIGESAATLLIERLEHPSTDREWITKVVKTSLIERDSTRRQ
jgi:LacI family transcriptional regulator